MKIDELEYRLLYSMVVAGKNATFATNALKRFFGDLIEWTPLDFVAYLSARGRLEERLREARTGNYTKLARGFLEASQKMFDLKTVTAQELETIHGVGPKTSRFFIIWTRPGARHAALDTHVLKWLRYMGHKAPLATPTGEKYARLEGIFLALADAKGMTARDLDAAIWDWCSAYPERARADIWPATLQR